MFCLLLVSLFHWWLISGRRNGYGVDPPGQANLAICSSAVGQRYNCLAFTLEMPFKDVHYAREPVQGWSPERSVRFGAAMLNAILAVVPDLR